MKQINAQAHIPSQSPIEYSNRGAVHIPAHSRTFQSRASYSRTAHSRSSRRRGQALLITVLLMVFASVLAATFVTVVALNLSQTARSGSVASAKQAALAGKNFVNDQLTNSELGERWTEIDAQTPPLASAPEYAFYYTDFERAQGWDQQGFVKFPNPLSPTATTNGSSVFLTKVTDIIDSATAASLGLSNDYIGQLKVDVIGRATDNDATFSKLTFYKPTSRNGNFTGIARYVTRWDWSKGKISDAAFKPPTDPGYSPTYISGGLLNDLDVTGNGASTNNTDVPSQTAQGGYYINGNALFQGKTQLQLASTRDVLQTSGSIAIDVGAQTELRQGAVIQPILASTDTTPRTGLQLQIRDGGNSDPTSRSGLIRVVTPNRIDKPFSRWLNLTRYADASVGAPFGYGDKPDIGGGVFIDNKQDIETVGRTVPNGTINGRPTFRPMTIAEIQRMLQRRSFEASSNATTTTPNVFNTPDLTNLAAPVEFGNADITSLNNGEYSTGRANQRLAWARPTPTFTGPPPPPSYNFPVAAETNVTDTRTRFFPSLEQRGVRGWISPYEFLPRGVLVELQGNRIVITRDDMSDQAPYEQNASGFVNDSITPTNFVYNPKYNNPDWDRVWKDFNGNPILGCYRMEIDVTSGVRILGAENATTPLSTYTPSSGEFNGVIFAEGNVRVRGFVNNKDITIVSLGSIYIEGGINKSGTGNVALLAKRNVVLNPTGFAARPAGSRIQPPSASSVLLPPATPLSTSANPIVVTVTETLPFRVGDLVRFGGQSDWWTVLEKSIDRGNGDLVLDNQAGRTLNVSNTDNVAVLRDPNTQTLGDQKAYRISGSNAIFTRNLLLDGSTSATLPSRVSAVHAGGERRGLLVTPQTTEDTLSIKQDTSGTPNAIEANEKSLTAGTTPAVDLITPPADTLSGLASLFTAPAGPPPPDPNINWDMTALFPTAPSYRLTAVDLSGMTPNIARPVLLTTSVGMFWQQNITSLGGATLPSFTVGSSNLIGDTEDIRTVNERFYGAFNSTNNFDPAYLRGTDYSVTSTPNTTANNLVSLRYNQSAGNDVADYNVAALKYERDTFNDQVNTPIEVDVNAIIYAQEGSWFVIPMPAMTSNSIGVLAERIENAHRYRRLNYKINVKANVIENFTPGGLTTTDVEQNPDQDPTDMQGRSALRSWLDASSYPVTRTGNLGDTWQTINYVAPTPLLPTNTLYLPITPDITLQR